MMGQYATVLHWGSPNGTLGKASKLQGYVRRDHPNCETTALADTESSRLGQYATVLHWEALAAAAGTSPPSFLMRPQTLSAMARVDVAAGLDGGCVRESNMENQPWRPLPRRQHPADAAADFHLLAAASADPSWTRDDIVELRR
jgi:hypothetical protein